MEGDGSVAERGGGWWVEGVLKGGKCMDIFCRSRSRRKRGSRRKLNKGKSEGKWGWGWGTRRDRTDVQLVLSYNTYKESVFFYINRDRKCHITKQNTSRSRTESVV